MRFSTTWSLALLLLLCSAATSTQAQDDAPAQDATPAAAPVTIKTYQNYDFTPGDTILFADDFRATQDGEFPEQWELVTGQSAVNKQQGFEALTMTDGNYAKINPRLKAKTYLGNQFTVEYDTFATPGAFGVQLFFPHEEGDAYTVVGKDGVQYVNGPEFLST